MSINRKEVIMNGRWKLGVVVVAWIVALAAGQVALAQGDSSGIPSTVFTAEGGDVPESTTYWVMMPDGVLLATEVWLPTTTGPFPTVLTRTPYSRFTPPDVPIAALQSEGYAVVSQEIRGCGQSGGTWYFYADDNADGHATIEWLTQQVWSNGKVGMLGGSGTGATQYAIARGAPAALKCLAPAHETPFRYELAWPGGSLFYCLIYNWMNTMGFLNLYDELLEHRLCDSWYDGSNWVDPPGEVHVPMLHMGRWYDFAQAGALGAFPVVQHQGGAGAAGNQYLYMDPLTHSHGYGGYPLPPSPISFETWRTQLKLDWLDYWLKDEPTGVDAWPKARIYVMGAIDEPDAPGNEWVEMRDWPPVAETRTFYLSQGVPPHGGGLGESLPPPGSSVLLIDPDDPVPTYGGANSSVPSGPYDQAAVPLNRPIESRDDVLTFTTDALTEPVTVIGKVRARIWINPDTPDLDLSVRLTDVHPDGKSILITDGIQRARMRCGCDQECFLPIGVPTEIEVDMWSTAMVFNAGHRIRVAIAGTNWERFERNDNSGGDLNNPSYTVAHPDILFGPAYPSALLLPIPALFADDFEYGDLGAWSVVMPEELRR
jgi:predicted acyl esterase